MKQLMLSIAMLIAGVQIAAAQTMVKDAKPCEAIKGKTYILWSGGKFDDNPDAAAAARIVFDASGKGTSRTFSAFRPTDATGTQFIQTVNCSVLMVAISGRSILKGKSYLSFANQNGTDAGQAFITSYDGGSKIWVEAASPGRPMKGWMLMLPPNPPAADNLIK